MDRPLHVITGAGSGIGAALARHAAHELGARVAVVDLSPERAGAVAEEITGDGGVASAHAVDVSDAAQVDQLAATLVGEHGAPAFVACNAGVEYSGPLWEMRPEDWRRVQGVNLDGAFTLTRSFLPAMIERDEPARLLYTSSVGGVTITGNQAAYVVSKHAVRALAQSVACDLEEIGAPIGVSILLPGAVSTRIFEDSPTSGSAGAEAYRSRLLSQLREGMPPEEAARLAYDGAARGQRWIYTDPERAGELLRRHVDELGAGVEAGGA